MHSQSSPSSTAPTLRRQVGLGGAILLGLGSILGTGIFVSFGLAVNVAGAWALLAIPVAAFVATCNGLSSAQLAANHPVSGGTYEYGYRWLSPTVGFIAGWLFLCAKSASAAAAALSCGGYLRAMLPIAVPSQIIDLGIVSLLTFIVLAGIRRTNIVNAILVAITLAALVLFVLAGAYLLTTTRFRASTNNAHFDLTAFNGPGFFEACALMFVAYTGYGRIATLGEEVLAPKRNIPRAVILTLLASMLIYLCVAATAVLVAGPRHLAEFTLRSNAPLESILKANKLPILAMLVSGGAIVAMLGVQLNLMLGLSRVLLAMGRRADLPHILARLNRHQTTPTYAVLIIGFLVGGMALFGDLELSWSFSAFTVLLYYAITNLCAIRLSAEERLYPTVISRIGLVGCLFLAAWVAPWTWLAGTVVITIGLVLRAFFRLTRSTH